MAAPLEGITVLEFTEIIAGPYGGMLLADMGADVIKVEPPWASPGASKSRSYPTRAGPSSR